MVLDNPSPFTNPFQFQITFECLEDLKEDLEWKIIYVGSAESEEYDQVLDSVLVGPLVGGRHKFVFQANPPDCNKIPTQDVVGVTVVLLTCSYKNQEFIRVGYYVNNEYATPELKENPPSSLDFEKLTRNILATCPRVTRFRIDWHDTGELDNTENQPPTYNMETESNQMTTDSNGDCTSKMSQDGVSGSSLKQDIISSSTGAACGLQSTDTNSQSSGTKHEEMQI